MESVPLELRRLLDAVGPAAREHAWGALVDAYSPLLLHVAQSRSRDHDAAMDAYTFILAALRHDDFRRLRRFVADGRCRFTTWLVILARRLCTDHHRQRYGRVRQGPEGDSIPAREQRAERFRLTDLMVEALDAADLAGDPSADPESQLRHVELHDRLQDALAELDPGSRLLIRLRFEDEVPVREIAQILHMPTPFHVYRALDRALTALRRQLEARGVSDAVP